MLAFPLMEGPYSNVTSAYAKMNEWMDEEGYSLNGSPF